MSTINRIFSIWIVVFSFLATTHLWGSDTLRVRYPPAQSQLDTRADYDRKIIQLLLEKTQSKYGPFTLVPSQRMNQSRALESLRMGKLVDVVVTTSNSERERQLLPIYHCVHRGMMGVRLLLIRKSTEEQFARIKDIDELKRLLAGQGHDWPDVTILRANGFRVETGPDYEGLFKMLAGKRFDYFPRSVAEIWDEQAKHEKDDLVVEKTIALVYPLPAYVFVKKENTKLADRLREGFDIALKDGSFDKLFFEKHSSSLAKAQLDGRRIFFLKNPLVPGSGYAQPDIISALRTMVVR